MPDPNVLPGMRDWWAANQPRPVVVAPLPPAPPRKRGEPVPRTPATPHELRAIAAIGPLRYPVAGFAKRFARDMQGATDLTDRQRATLWRQVYRYRRQIGAKDLVATAERIIAAEPPTTGNPKDFQPGDVIAGYGGEYVVVEPDRRGIAKLRNRATGAVEAFNANNNPGFALVRPAKPEGST